MSSLAAVSGDTIAEQPFWERYASVYESVLGRFTPHRRLMAALEDSQAGASPVLDVGCGPGILACRLARGGARVLGVDYNPRMIELARRKERPGLAFAVMDAHGLELPDGSFAGVVCSNVLYFVSDPAAALAEMRRVLRPGGRLALTGPLRGMRMDVLDRRLDQEARRSGGAFRPEDLETFRACNALLGSGGMRHLYSLAEVRALLVGEAGFAELLELRPAYLGQNYFAVARKGDR